MIQKENSWNQKRLRKFEYSYKPKLDILKKSSFDRFFFMIKEKQVSQTQNFNQKKLEDFSYKSD